MHPRAKSISARHRLVVGAENLDSGRQVCGLFRIAKIRAVEADTEEFEEALYRRVHHLATSM
jgi:hypothetical protein